MNLSVFICVLRYWKANMYINKVNYYIFKIFCILGVNFFGIIGAFFITGYGMDFVRGNATPKSVFVVALILWGLWIYFLKLNHALKKTLIYDSLFSNDADGVMLIKVIAKSIGVSEEIVLKDLRKLIKLRLIPNCTIVEGENSKVILSNAKATEASRINYIKVKCNNCGADNYIREGFIYGCQYCLGRIDRE